MGTKVITFGLDASAIDDAINELEAYKAEFQAKVDTYRQKLAAEIAGIATLNFGSSLIDDVLTGSPRTPVVTVNVEERGNISVVVADGKDAVWCEFGAGVYHNGAVGSSPNPYGTPLGFTIGSYGKGYGARKVWGYYDGGRLVLTRGTPASMPMYNAVQDVIARAIDIAKGVFGT